MPVSGDRAGSSFGVLGANIPAIIRGLIAVAWYGIQTYLASAALDVVLLKLLPGLAPYADVDQYGFLGPVRCSAGAASRSCGSCRRPCSGAAWKSIRKFIDFCGPAVYVVMFVLCGYLRLQGRLGDINLNLGDASTTGSRRRSRSMLGAIAWWCPTSPGRC